MSILLNAALRLLRRGPSIPRRVQSYSSRPTIDSTRRIEEETFDWYEPTHFYPVRLGQIFKAQYKVLAKLGYGGYSTTWLCRDLAHHRYVAVKVCTRTYTGVKREVEIYNRINSARANSPGAFVRTMLEHFELSDVHGTYQCIVHKPLSMTLETFRREFDDNRLPVTILKSVLAYLLLSLDFLHTELQVTHADIQDGNILFDLFNESDLNGFERLEEKDPTPCKTNADRTIYMSKGIFPQKFGHPILCDFGQARFGQQSYSGIDIQPFQYRAPEVILDIPWDEKADIWNVGVMVWDLFEDKLMFKTSSSEKKRSTLHHMAHMVALLGPPPKDFLARSESQKPWKYFDEEGESKSHLHSWYSGTHPIAFEIGSWKGDCEVPKDSLEASEENLTGEDQVVFLQFMRQMLKWEPEERSTARELLNHPFLTGSVDGKPTTLPDLLGMFGG